MHSLKKSKRLGGGFKDCRTICSMSIIRGVCAEAPSNQNSDLPAYIGAHVGILQKVPGSLSRNVNVNEITKVRKP